jgi:hypothetical protein
MRVELIELLRTRAIFHPSRIISTSLNHEGALRIRAFGIPWWHKEPKLPEGAIEYVFSGIDDGEVDLGRLPRSSDDEAWEIFEVRSLADVGWAQPSCFDIYCNGPLLRPFSLYQAVHDYLELEHSFFRADDFLNFGSSRLLADYQKIVASNSYLVARAPDAIRALVCAELDAQGVGYSVISHSRQPETRLWVRLEGLDVICEAAYAEFEE